MTGKTLFAQLMDFLPWSTFTRIVARYDGDHRVRALSCAEQYRAMAFAQLTYRESLRDIEVCLSAQPSKLYHMGFREPVRRSTLADANEARDWRIYAEFAHRLNSQARRLYATESFERINQLGGEPNFKPEVSRIASHSEYSEGEDLQSMIREDLVAERIAIEWSSEIVRWLANDDPTTRRIVEDILKTEEEHADDMSNVLERRMERFRHGRRGRGAPCSVSLVPRRDDNGLSRPLILRPKLVSVERGRRPAG
jgi:bacterioferritin (cytochrome b1)